MLVALGLIVLSSASEANSIRLHHGDALFFMKRQFMYLGAGIAVAAAVAMFDYRRWRDSWVLTALFYALVFALLLVVFKYPPINGSRRWINLGLLRLQPSELAKLVVVIALAVWLDLSGWKVELFRRGALWPAAITAFMVVPVVAEPDFGSAMVISLSSVLVMTMAGVRFLHMLPLFAAGACAVAYRVLTNANRRARLMAFFFGGDGSSGTEVVLDEAAKRANYQVEQAIVAIQNGGVDGVGYGDSMQKHLYLPEAHTDFVFAVGAEEMGLLFTIGAILLFAAFFALSVYIARKASDRLGRFLALGMGSLIFFQAMFNLGVVCKALPTKGMALPFFSYGGTNLLAAFFAAGTILSVGIHSFRDRKRKLSPKVLAR